MSKVNRHGLSRDIPTEVKRKLRQEAGFGCVVCGKAIITYEHIDPVFADATCHDPENMTILCGHCHGKVTRGLLSKTTIKLAKQNPKAKSAGFSNDAFDIGAARPIVRLGTSIIRECESIISVNGVSMFSVDQPECDGGPFRLNAKFYNSGNELMFSILDNEFEIESANWDVEIVGQTITIKDANSQVALKLRTCPPGAIMVEKLDMSFEKARFFFDGDKFAITAKDGSQFSGFGTANYSGHKTVLNVTDDGIAVGVGGGSTSFSAS